MYDADNNGLNNYCLRCMRRRRRDEDVCPVCGCQAGQEKWSDFALRPGTQLHDGKYLVGETLGQGGFGITYVGLDTALGLKVAIKEYYPSGQASRSQHTSELLYTTAESGRAGRESFVREAQRMALADAIPGIVQVRDVFFQNSTAYIVMGFIEGETLKARLMRDGILTPENCVRTLMPVMEALKEAHGKGLIHRDISPDNIMIDNDGKIWLLDMGAAKEIEIGERKASEDTGGFSKTGRSHEETRPTQTVIKKGFSPPEQSISNGNVGPWTDVYAMCATIYYCLTGNLVPESMARALRDTLSFPGTFPGKLTETLRDGLALHTEERIQSMDELLNRLKPLAGADDMGKNGKIDPKPKPWRKIVAACAVLACMVALVIGLMNRDDDDSHNTSNTSHTDVTESDRLHVTTLGNSNTNVVNYGGVAVYEQEWEYFVGGDNAIYAVPWNAENRSFYLDQKVKVCEMGGHLTLGDGKVYFGASFDGSRNAICRMDKDGRNMEILMEESEGHYCNFLQFAALSDGKEYLYYMRQNDTGDFSYRSLYRYDLQKNKEETLIEGNLWWFNLYEDAIYYTSVPDEGGIYLMKCGLDGSSQKKLDGTKNYLYGFAEDGKLYLWSMKDEAIQICDLEGKLDPELKPLYLDMDAAGSFGYDAGWIYYTNTVDNSIHRVRTNGTGDTLAVKGHSQLLIGTEDNWVWLIERVATGKEHQYRQETYIADRSGSWCYPLDTEDLVWDLSTPLATDFSYEKNGDGTGVVITGYHGEMTKLAIPKKIDGMPVVAIGGRAFQESTIAEVAMPETLTGIEEYAFFKCQNLDFVGLPDSLVSIGEAAFGECGALTAIDLPENLSEVGELAFAETNLKEVFIPAGLNELGSIGSGAFAVRYSAGLQSFTVSQDNGYYFAVDGVLYGGTKDVAGLIAYPPGRGETSYSLYKNTVVIFPYAFAHARDLERVSIPENVGLISENAFADTGITSITVNGDCEVAGNLGGEITVQRGTGSGGKYHIDENGRIIRD